MEPNQVTRAIWNRTQAAASGFGSRRAYGRANLHANSKVQSASFKFWKPRHQGESRSFRFLGSPRFKRKAAASGFGSLNFRMRFDA